MIDVVAFVILGGLAIITFCVQLMLYKKLNSRVEELEDHVTQSTTVEYNIDKDILATVLQEVIENIDREEDKDEIITETDSDKKLH